MASSSAETNLATAKTILSTAASVAATTMLVRSIAQDFIPYEIQHYLFSSFKNLFNTFSSQLNIVIEEFDGLMNNQIYEAAESYLSTKISPSTQKLKASKSVKENVINISIERDQVIVDDFHGIKITWILVCKRNDSPAPNKYIHNVNDLNSMLRSETRSFEINFHKKHRDMILKTYLPYVVNEARKIKQVKKTLKIFTNDSSNIYNGSDAWMSTNLDHPATFETLALDLEMKNFIVEDLERFVARKEYYKKVGKAWKRGYLLYGPPGTGKSSLIAAMANYLKFDVYDLELTEIRCNSELRRLLIAMANRSILVVEDIDCSIEFQDRMNNNQPRMIHHRGFDEDQKVTLSGLLNFIDGLWSSCGDERIIVFTTNHKEKLDSALLRPGRMDVHVHMSYCTPSGFRLLAANYLGIKDHTLFGEIEQELRSIQVTPAEVAEQLIKSDDHDNTLNNLLEFFRLKKRENEEASAKNDIGEGELGDKEVHNETEDNEVDNDDKSDRF